MTTLKSSEQQDYLNCAAAIASQCDRCGSCTTVCPLYKEKGHEAAGARGKNNLVHGLARGVLEPTEELLKASEFCLLCRACVDNCPNKVATDEAMISLRQHLTDGKGGPSMKYRLIGQLMAHQSWVKLSAFGMDVLRRLKLNRLIPGGLIPSEYSKCDYLKNFSGPATLGTPATPQTVTLTDQSRVAYFHACGMNMMFPDAVTSSKQLIAKVAGTAPTNINNECCGIVHLAHGMRKKFIQQAKKNIELYADVDVVITDCASCSGTLKHMAGYFQDDSQWAEKAKQFSNKVMGLSEYLNHSGYVPQTAPDVKLTFHEPCHLGRGQSIRQQPRQLLKQAGTFIEMQGADKCCGGSGTFATDFPDVSNRLLQDKQGAIEATGADIVVTECPVCLSQMNKASAASGKFKAMHISQIL